MTTDAADAPAEVVEAKQLGLSITYDRAINYAFQQNAIPTIQELRFQNDEAARKDLTFRLTTEPAFALPSEIRLQALAAGHEFRVTPVELKLSHDENATHHPVTVETYANRR